MEKIGCGQGTVIMKKGKKKQAKDEIDRQKQAEKKKRRLEKALATSAAIRSELEKKKQKKMEEQLRLDQEGAAIAESVALHVLLGEEDKDESYPIMLSKNRKYNSSDHSNDIGVFKGYQNSGKHSQVRIGWAASGYEAYCQSNNWGISHALPSGVHLRNFQAPYYEETSHGVDLSVGLIAAQAVSSLQIAENSGEELFTGQGARAIVFDRMFGSSSLGNEINFYEF